MVAGRWSGRILAKVTKATKQKRARRVDDGTHHRDTWSLHVQVKLRAWFWTPHFTAESKTCIAGKGKDKEPAPGKAALTEAGVRCKKFNSIDFSAASSADQHPA